MRQKFWMVLGEGTPVVRHDTYDKAKTEAGRLARAYPGKEFTVMESSVTAVSTLVTFEEHLDLEVKTKTTTFANQWAFKAEPEPF